jgi:undecaprenyl phosphate N,N'-diacetylbacillosamine 1-phosphate transferase
MSFRTIKNLTDIFFAFIFCIITLPVMLICALMIKIEDPKGSVIYKAKRAGLNKKPFFVYKFRSMKVDTELNGRKLSDDERMLKSGYFFRKYSLDELPQFINILKGEMSFIGPRPLPVLYLPYYTDIEIHRHDVKPGISGLAQVNGRNFISWDDKLRFDVEYVNNLSFTLDFKILLLTFKKVFFKPEVGVRGVDYADKSLHEIRTINRNYKNKDLS